MAKPKKDRAKGKKAVEDLAVKDVATGEAQGVSGGADGRVSLSEITIKKTTDTASPGF
jgi:hypothetical protein